MAEPTTPLKTLPLSCTIVEANVKVGSGTKGTNTIVIQITNTDTAPITFAGIGAKGELALAISTGHGREHLTTLEDGVALTITQNPNRWALNPRKTLKGQLIWSFTLSKPVLEPKAGLRLTLSNFESHVDPGPATMTISAKISGYTDYTNMLSVEKKDEHFDLLYFTADPPYLITDEDKRNFTLRWNTVKARRAVLYGYNRVTLKTFDSGDEGCRSGTPYAYTKEPLWAPTTSYELEITDAANDGNSISSKVSVQMLSSGWYPVTLPYGYPAVLCSMNNVHLYGIFVKEGKASLYTSEYPYAKWMLTNEAVPEGMSTSPAVCWKNRLWLIGGGAADPKLRNREIWCYDGNAGTWKQHPQPPWTSRMGHACVIMNDQLWVLGGNDETGTSLNDVWVATLNGDILAWQKQDAVPGWKPRCMFAATTVQGEKDYKLWIYGGLTEPFSDPFEDLWSWDSRGKTWQRYPTIPQDDNGNPIGKPIGAALTVLNGQLHLFGSFRNGTMVEQSQCILREGQQTWGIKKVSPGWNEQQDNTFSLVAVQYKGLVFLRSLDYRTRDNPTTLLMHIPPK